MKTSTGKHVRTSTTSVSSAVILPFFRHITFFSVFDLRTRPNESHVDYAVQVQKRTWKAAADSQYLLLEPRRAIMQSFRLVHKHINLHVTY
jgi:hypothetical protein